MCDLYMIGRHLEMVVRMSRAFSEATLAASLYSAGPVLQSRWIRVGIEVRLMMGNEVRRRMMVIVGRMSAGHRLANSAYRKTSFGRTLQRQSEGKDLDVH